MKKYAKIINEETKLCEVGLGSNANFYQSIGMTEQEVEQGFDGQWYLLGFAPEKPLEELKTEKRAEINATREKARLEEYAEYDNDKFDIDEASQSNILAQIKVAELLQNDKATYVYRSKTNQSHLFNVYQLQELGLLIAQKVSEIYTRSWDLKAKIDAAETIEEVNAIEWYNPGNEVESAS